VQLEWHDLSTGAVVRTLVLPTHDVGSQHAFALSGAATSEGLLAFSGAYFTLAGYGSAPGIGSVNSASGVARVVARIGIDGGLDTSTAITDGYEGNNVRAAATLDGSAFWLAGTAAMNAGVRSVPFGSSTSADVSSAVSNVRAVKVASGQLYASTSNDAGAGVPRVFAVGQGLPLATTFNVPLSGVSVLQAGDFALLDRDGTPGPDSLYVVDTGSGVGVRHFELSGAGWVERASFQTPPTVACIGVAAKLEANSVTVLCTGSNGSIYRWEDDGASADAGMASTVIVAPAGTAFRGVSF
jgi:hypothetical protein